MRVRLRQPVGPAHGSSILAYSSELAEAHYLIRWARAQHAVALFVDDVSQIKNGREISPAIPAGRRYLYEPVTPIDRAPLERLT
jgi:hypothetical protein